MFGPVLPVRSSVSHRVGGCTALLEQQPQVSLQLVVFLLSVRRECAAVEEEVDHQDGSLAAAVVEQT